MEMKRKQNIRATYKWRVCTLLLLLLFFGSSTFKHIAANVMRMWPSEMEEKYVRKIGDTDTKTASNVFYGCLRVACIRRMLVYYMSNGMGNVVCESAAQV